MIQTKKFQFNLTHFRRQFRDSSLPLGDLICEIGKYFLNVPYKAGTLESGHKEKLILNFAQFDCFTFLETVLALTRCVIAGEILRSEFRRALQAIRYRKGIIDGYSSRLHYFTDWLRNNEQKKILRDISRKPGAVAERGKINYMTTHRSAYNALRDENEFKKMLLTEKNLSRKTFHVIDKNKIGQIKNEIQNGDIIAFATNLEGLDVTHVGFALWQGKKLYLLHASSKEGAVVISKKTLVAYLKSNKKFSGIFVARLQLTF